MDLIVRGRNVEIPEEVRGYLQKKMRRLSRHLPNLLEAVVELSRGKSKSSSEQVVVQVTLNSNGTLLRGEEKAQDFYSAIDAVADVLDRQIERYKGKLYRVYKGRSKPSAKTQQTSANLPPSQEAPPLTEEGQVVKVKRFSLKPMDEGEAAQQMELLGHDFFVFLNSATGRLGVLYRRKDGNYGLIDPEPS